MGFSLSNTPGLSQLLLVGFDVPQTDAVKQDLLEQAVVQQHFEAFSGALHAVFYSEYDVCIIRADQFLSLTQIHLLREAQHACPWRGYILLRPHDMPRDQITPFLEHIDAYLVHEDDVVLLRAVLHRIATEKEQWTAPMNAHVMATIMSMLERMRAASVNVPNEPDLVQALSSFISHISGQLDLSFLGMVVFRADPPFLLLHYNDSSPAACVEANIQSFQQQLKELHCPIESIATIRKTNPNFAFMKTDDAHVSNYPIIIKNKIMGWLAIAMPDQTRPHPLYYPLIIHIVHYVAMIFSSLQYFRNQAERDPLTNIHNRRYMEESSKRLFLLARRYYHSIAVLFIDVDRFKQINDRFGHETGDSILKEIAIQLTACLRQSDVVARYGGDEFVVVLPHASATEAINTGHRIQQACRELKIGPHTQRLNVTLSIGVAISQVNRSLENFEDLVRKADEALLEVKSTGGNQVKRWAPKQVNPELEEMRLQSGKQLESEYQLKAAESKGNILLVDDDPTIIKYLNHVLRAHEFNVCFATCGNEALHILSEHPGVTNVIICDINMPDMNGFELLQQAQNLDAALVIILMTADVNTERAVLALRNGARDLLQKPFTNDQLLLAVERALEYHELRAENRNYQAQLINIVNMKSSESRRALEKIKAAYDYTFDTVVAMLDAREKYTSRHSIRVRDLTILMAREIGFKPNQIDMIARGALLHDIGKIGIPDAILQKPGPLTPDERLIMQTHPEIGFNLLKENHVLKGAANVVLSHHERWDGAGYPHGLDGTNIPHGARIFSIIDSYDAIRSKRIYKPGIPPEKAIRLILKDSGTCFDPELIKIFTELQPLIEQTGGWDDSDS